VKGKNIMPPIGQIILFPYDFAPRGFSFCNGNLVPVAFNQQLFKYLGTAYGGDGKMSFGIPDIDQLAPANCHYCIAMEGTLGGEYKGYCGETFPLPNNAEAGNVEKCDGRRLDIGKAEQLFNLIDFKFGGDYNAGFNLPDLSSTPPTKAYGYRITLDGLSREAFIGELLLLPTNDQIMGLHICNGELLAVQQNAALFGLLGYRFGGDSKTQKFALPKLYAPDNYHYYIALSGPSPSRP
jgi:microcystin-dependent protein